jgi:predicted metal-binding membrane protein
MALLFVASTALTILFCTHMPLPGAMRMPGMRMAGQSGLGSALAFMSMWFVMMVAMMLPSLTPRMWRYRQVVGEAGDARLNRLTALVGAGYFFVWTMSGVVVLPLEYAADAVKERLPQLSHAGPGAVAVIVLLAGALQFTQWKARHLSRCREAHACGVRAPGSPRTAWRHGVCLGVHCLHCCFGLMVILLSVGIMDLRVMAVVTTAITAERVAPRGERVARAVGAIAIAAGLYLVARTSGPA